MTTNHIWLYRNMVMGKCKKDVTPLLMHWCYIFLALTHQFHVGKLGEITSTSLQGQWVERVKFYTTASNHYSDIIMGVMASQITSLTIVYSTIYSGTDQRKHQSSASMAFVWGIHRWLVNSLHKWPVMRKMFPFEDFIMMQVWSNMMDLQNTVQCHY